MVPEKWSPENCFAENWSSKKCPSKIVLRQKNTRKSKRLFHFYRLIHTHTHTTRTKICLTFTSRSYICPGRFDVEFWDFIDWLHLNIPHTHHDARRSPHDFLFPSFVFVAEFWVFIDWSYPNIPHTHTPRCSTLTPRFFVSEFWVCFRVLGFHRLITSQHFTHTHTRTHTHTHTTMLDAHPTIFCFWASLHYFSGDHFSRGPFFGDHFSGDRFSRNQFFGIRL